MHVKIDKATNLRNADGPKVFFKEERRGKEERRDGRKFDYLSNKISNKKRENKKVTKGIE